ncbi:hypothetical protein J7643_13505 [bacterium]|nr:hypothetical protein [bacterium]
MRSPFALRARRAAGLSLFLALGVGAPALAAPAPRAPFTPHVGDTMRYAITGGDSYVMRVVKTRGDDGRTLALVEETHDTPKQETRDRLTWVRTDQGMALVLGPTNDSSMEQSPLICYLANSAPKDTWTAQSGRYRDTDGSVTEFRIFARLEAIETVTVPAGTFAGCYRIAYQAATKGEPASERTRMQLWFKPELGIVKTRSVQGETVTETTLTGYQTASFGQGGTR